jgi:hypothetical protein
MHTNGHEAVWGARPPRPGGPMELSRGQRPRASSPNRFASRRDAGTPASASDVPPGRGSVLGSFRGRCPRLSSAVPPGRKPAPPGPTHFATQNTGNPLAMNGISLKSSLQTPYPAAQGALPCPKRCLTFSEKVAHLFGKGALPFRQGCQALWDRAGHPRRPGALGSTTWPDTATRTGLNCVPEVTWQSGPEHRLDFHRAGNK